MGTVYTLAIQSIKKKKKYKHVSDAFMFRGKGEFKFQTLHHKLGAP
jgi:hypothetical protein